MPLFSKHFFRLHQKDSSNLLNINLLLRGTGNSFKSSQPNHAKTRPVNLRSEEKLYFEIVINYFFFSDFPQLFLNNFR